MEGLEKKAYALAKQFENNYNKQQLTCLQKYYLELVEDFLRGQNTKDIPTELQSFTKSLKNEIQRTMQEFQNLLPKGDLKDDVSKSSKKYRNR